MAMFKTFEDVTKSIGFPDDLLEARKPGNLTKADEKKWVPTRGGKWECGCYTTAGPRTHGITSSRVEFYYFFPGVGCKKHANVKGNHERSSAEW